MTPSASEYAPGNEFIRGPDRRVPHGWKDLDLPLRWKREKIQRKRQKLIEHFELTEIDVRLFSADDHDRNDRSARPFRHTDEAGPEILKPILPIDRLEIPLLRFRKYDQQIILVQRGDSVLKGGLEETKLPRVGLKNSLKIK